MNPSRILNTVHRAVALIEPVPEDRETCLNAVHVALAMTGGSVEDLQKHFRLRGNPGRRAAARLHKALRDLQRAIRHPDLPADIRLIMPDDDPEHWRIERGEADNRRFNYKAQKKLEAAEAAFQLLRQFNRKITAEKDSAFRKLSALFCGERPDRLQWTCRGVISRAKATAVLSPENK